MNWPRRLMVALSVIAVGGLAACNNHDQPFDGGQDPPVIPCVDRDGDGYGVSCDLGFDCNDYDPAVTWPCDEADPCARPNEGCPCLNETEAIPCRTSDPVESEDGTLTCYAGTRTCAGGVWTACEDLHAYDPQAEPDAADDDGTRREPILDQRSICASCDDGCNLVHDCPSQRDLGPGVSDNLMYDAIHPPPALILEDIDDPGTFHRYFAAGCPNPSFEAFTWWGVVWHRHTSDPGGPYADVVAPSRLTVAVRTAPTAAELGTATGTAWHTVIDCPTVNCPFLAQDDRQAGAGNIYDALIGEGIQAVRNPFIEYVVTMTAGGAAVSPRFTSIDFYFFCDEAT